MRGLCEAEVVDVIVVMCGSLDLDRGGVAHDIDEEERGWVG